MADVFETDIPKLRIGQMATVRMPYQSGGGFTARVNYVQPQVDPQTRTIKLRLEAANPAMQLKPEMFVDVEFRLASNRQLTVPVDAVLDAGQRQTVFVDRGNGYLEPRQVQVGDRLGDRVVISAGLKAGESIVTSANFLIDSESQLKSAIAGMGGHQHGALPKVSGKQVPSPSGGHVHD
jgi:Cu(I)/Ag(I) efflux system membrane fusion protein